MILVPLEPICFLQLGHFGIQVFWTKIKNTVHSITSLSTVSLHCSRRNKDLFQRGIEGIEVHDPDLLNSKVDRFGMYIKPVPRRQMEIANHDEASSSTFREEKRFQHLEAEENLEQLSTPFNLHINKYLTVRVMGTEKHGVLTPGSVLVRNILFGLGKLPSIKSAMMLKSEQLIAYHVHAVLLNFSPHCHIWSINNGHTVFRFLPVGNVGSREYFDEDYAAWG